MEKHDYFHQNGMLKWYKLHPTLQRASIPIYSPISVSLVLFGDRRLGWRLRVSEGIPALAVAPLRMRRT